MGGRVAGRAGGRWDRGLATPWWSTFAAPEGHTSLPFEKTAAEPLQHSFTALLCGRIGGWVARIRCPECKKELLLAFSCKGRGLCPSCGAKRAAAFAAFLPDELLAEVGHAQWVFTVPKLLRPYFMHHPELLGPLCSAAWETVRDLMAETVCEKQGFRPGMVAVVQTFGDQLNLHPHVHALVCAAPLLTAPPDRRRGKSNFLSLIP